MGVLYILEGGGLLGTAGEAAREHALQGVLECLPEVAVEVCVDQGVEGGVEVAYPEQDGDHDVRAVAGVAAQRGDHVPAGRRKSVL